MHTLGPWQTTIARNGHVSIYPIGGLERVADVYCPLDRDTDDSVGGNARLIAAAPDLLAACKAALEALDATGAVDCDPDFEICQQLRAAIAKATQTGALP